ncbi:hypothetical protein QTN25_010071 [Entamoeba marina]
MLILFALVAAIYAQDTCESAYQIPSEISDSYSFTGTFNLNEMTRVSGWSCQQVDSDVHMQKAMHFTFTAATSGLIEVSTCYSQTDFSNRIIVGKQCTDEVTSQCVGANDGDVSGLCGGHRSRLIVTVEASQTYYVTVAGLTADDVGQFKLTIENYINPTSYECSTATTVSLPTIIDGTITSEDPFYATTHGFKRGIWFKFVATQTTHYIDTCNKYTEEGTTLYLYKNPDLAKKCMSDYPIAEASDGCGSYARLGYDNFVVGDTYHVFLFFTEDTSDKPVVGSYQIAFRNNGGDNYKCSAAFSISKTPFDLLMDMTGYTNSTSSCQLNNEVTGMYFKMHGNGKRYAFHTCYTGSSGDDKTEVELYEGGCDSCSSISSRTCGNDAYADVWTRKGETYYFRVVCSNPTCVVNIQLMEIDSTSNDACDSAKVLNITRGGDQFTQYLVGHNLEASSISCDGKTQDLQGGWFKLHAEEDMNIMHGVVAYHHSLYDTYLAVFDDCDSCSTANSGEYLTLQLQIKSGQTRYIFATAIRQEGTESPFGIFMYWAVRRENIGGSYDDSYEVKAPFTGIFPIGSHSFSPQCTHIQFPYTFTYPAVSIRYEQPADTEYTVSTCGEETVMTTMTEIIYQNNDNYVCYGTVDVADCGNGASIITEDESVKYAVVGSNPSASLQNGVLRFNLYEDKQEESSLCSSAESISSLPSTHFSYTTKAASSIGKCGIYADGLKGKWFTYTSKKDQHLMISTDDISTFTTQIGIYDSCSVIEEDSVPGSCVLGEHYQSSPVGQRGTMALLDAKEGKTYYIFVGGSSNTESGLMRVVFEEYTVNEDGDDDGLSGGQIFGIVCGVLLVVVITIAVIVFVGFVVFQQYKKKHSSSLFTAF